MALGDKPQIVQPADKARAIEIVVAHIEKQFGKGALMRLGEASGSTLRTWLRLGGRGAQDGVHAVLARLLDRPVRRTSRSESRNVSPS